MRRFFSPQRLKISSEYPLDDTVYHHWCRVLRANVGDEAVLFDGHGGEYHCQLTVITKKNAYVKIDRHMANNRTNPFDCHISLVMSRGDRLDYAIQKATEMGVTSIQLLKTQYCEVKIPAQKLEKKRQHWQQIAISACEQCGLNLVPTVHAPLMWRDYLKTLTQCEQIAELTSHSHTWQVMLAPNPNQDTPHLIDMLRGHINTVSAISDSASGVFLIGGEGGFSPEEIDQAAQSGFVCCHLGERILRTETAPIVLLSILQTILY